ncbi:hypothetical protein HDU91_005973 [Kappamyces sp. JEL0680]|nr:hypothetical protein HDU91_005973 [Kappamyces sp. JEL0680]
MNNGLHKKLEDMLQTHEAQLAAKQELLNNLSLLSEKLESEIVDLKARNMPDAVVDQAQSASLEFSELQTKIASQHSEIQSLNQTLSDTNLLLDKATTGLQELEAEKQAQAAKAQETEKDLSEMMDCVEELEIQERKSLQSIEELESEILALHTQCTALAVEKDSLQVEVQSLTSALQKTLEENKEVVDGSVDGSCLSRMNPKNHK